MSITIYFVLIVLGFFATYQIGIYYLRTLRKEPTRTATSKQLLVTSIFFGSPIVLLLYLMFKEIREDDRKQRYMLLIGSLILLSIHIVMTVFFIQIGWIKLLENVQ